MHLRCRGGGKQNGRHHQCQATNPKPPPPPFWCLSVCHFWCTRQTGVRFRWSSMMDVSWCCLRTSWCGFCCLAALTVVGCKAAANGIEPAEHQCHQAATAWELHQWCSTNMAPVHQPDISTDYRDSPLVLRLILALGGRLPRGRSVKPHQIQFPLYRTTRNCTGIQCEMSDYLKCSHSADATNAVEMFGDICEAAWPPSILSPGSLSSYTRSWTNNAGYRWSLFFWAPVSQENARGKYLCCQGRNKFGKFHIFISAPSLLNSETKARLIPHFGLRLKYSIFIVKVQFDIGNITLVR